MITAALINNLVKFITIKHPPLLFNKLQAPNVYIGSEPVLNLVHIVVFVYIRREPVLNLVHEFSLFFLYIHIPIMKTKIKKINRKNKRM